MIYIYIVIYSRLLDAQFPTVLSLLCLPPRPMQSFEEIINAFGFPFQFCSHFQYRSSVLTLLITFFGLSNFVPHFIHLYILPALKNKMYRFHLRKTIFLFFYFPISSFTNPVFFLLFLTLFLLPLGETTTTYSLNSSALWQINTNLLECKP